MTPMSLRPLFACSLALLVAAPGLDAAVRPHENGGAPPATYRDRYGEARQGPEQTERESRTFAVGDGAALDVSNISGDVQVTGGSGREIRVEATRRVRHRDADEARRLLREMRVEFTHVGNRVEVRTQYPRRTGGSGRNISASVDYLITVPASAIVAIKTIAGNARVTQVHGEVRAEAISGDVEVTGARNLALAKTVSGNVTVREATGAAGLSLATISGNVTAATLQSRALDCTSVSGNIVLTGVQVERLDAKSLSGNIDLGATLARGGRYQVGSHSGDIRITLGNDTGFELDANTFSGTLRTDVPVVLRGDAAASETRRRTPRTIRGTFGDGSALLSVKTFSGSVVIGRK
ncbi:MAG: DUF4097 family beta strand repeat protein [Acidobacteria bacterium]|nr:DUF4097 family beta strand repeat protein [Acidobacteriota bacterium]